MFVAAPAYAISAPPTAADCVTAQNAFTAAENAENTAAEALATAQKTDKTARDALAAAQAAYDAAKTKLADAKAALAAAQANLDKVNADPASTDAQKAAAQTAVDNANAAVVTATADLDAKNTTLAQATAAVFGPGATRDKLADARKAENAARVTLNKAKAAVNKACNPPPPPPATGVSYRDCAAALAAVGHPLVRGVDAGYRIGLDRDQDGTACEKVEGNPPATVQNPPVVYKVINGQKCKWSGTAWVPVTQAPCPDCATTPPPVEVINPAPTVVVVPPAQPRTVFQDPVVPSGPVATGDGSLAND